MTLQIVPLLATPSQELAIELGGQACRLNVYAKAGGLFVDVLVNDALVIGGVIARNLDRIVRSTYLGFAGDFYFFDTAGAADPVYPELGSRFVLIYDDLR